MKMTPELGLIWIMAGMIAGCTGARISLEHFSEGYGDAPPAPRPGGSGPPQFQRIIELPTDDFAIPSTLPELLETYRLKLVMMGRPFPEGVAERYANAEIAVLKRQYAGNDEALQAELTKRLRLHAAPSHPHAGMKQQGSAYPVDEREEK